MFYKFNDLWELENSSNVNIDWSYIDIEFSDDEIALINKKYDYINLEFVNGARAKAFETEQNNIRKQEIIKELLELKTIKDGLELVLWDTKEVDAKILELQTEYKNIS